MTNNDVVTRLMYRITYWIARKLGAKLGTKITGRFLREVEKDFRVGLGFVDQIAYKDAESLGAKQESGFHGIQLRIKLDNRSKEDVRVEKALLKIFINGVPYKHLFWDEEVDELLKLEVKEVEFYPSTTISEEGFLILRCFVPPWININRSVWVKVHGFLYLKSPFGMFKKEVIAEKRIEKNEWK